MIVALKVPPTLEAGYTGGAEEMVIFRSVTSPHDILLKHFKDAKVNSSFDLVWRDARWC